jgi:F-type H+-transporting ATPase subunit b
MPQIEQLPLVFGSQLFWLALVFAVIFFVAGRGMLPKIRSTIAQREKAIANDLEKARTAQEAAAQVEAEWRARMDRARLEAARIAEEAKRQAAREIELRLKEALDDIDAKVERSRLRIRKAVQLAHTEVEAAMVEATAEIVEQLTGLRVGKKQAAEAFTTEFRYSNSDMEPIEAPVVRRNKQRAASVGR